jgi:hypothetical protein
MMWTSDSVYECHVNASLPRIFRDLLCERRDSQCLRLLSLMLPRPGLYLAKLFEDAADDAMMEKDYDRALLLYRRSQVSSAKLLRKFLDCSNCLIVMSAMLFVVHRSIH